MSGERILEDTKITKLSVLRNIEKVYQCKDSIAMYGANKHYFSLALTRNGQLFSWGGNRENQLGTAFGRQHSIFATLITSLYGTSKLNVD